jgi:hypothetical protein
MTSYHLTIIYLFIYFITHLDLVFGLHINLDRVSLLWVSQIFFEFQMFFVATLLLHNVSITMPIPLEFVEEISTSCRLCVY